MLIIALAIPPPPQTKREKKHGLPENWVRFYLAELCLALDYLHGMNIVFRDLKAVSMLHRHNFLLLYSPLSIRNS